MIRYFPILLVALLAASCTGSGTVAVSGDRDGCGSQFCREVAPFPVLAEDGVPYPQPFLGGFNVPRPQFADIDADGDADLFVQEVSGSVRFFEHVDSAFVWRTDAWQGLDVGEWYRFVDVDVDGDLDLFAEERFSHIRVYRNDGTPERASMRLAADTLRDAGGRPIFSDRQNIPNVVDLDCDGRLDLLLGQVTGMVTRYESEGIGVDGLPLFRFVTDHFEDIEIIGELQQSQTRHGANTLSFGDVDSDGDLDLFWGDFFEPGILLIRNRGTCAEPSFRGEPEPFPVGAPLSTSGYNAPAPVDIDADGDLDLGVGVLGGAFNANSSIVENLYFLEQRSGGDFNVRTSRFIQMIDVGSDSVPRAADIDGDGDLDLLVSNKIEPDDQQVGRVYLFENMGSTMAPAFAGRGALTLAASFHQTPAPGDLDGDGDTDLLVGKWNRETDYFRNDGDGVFVEVASPLVSLTRGSNSSPVLVDIDRDDDLDLFVGESSGTINFYVNTGSGTDPVFELVSDEWLGIDVGRRSVPAFGDLDGDGDLDLLVGTELDGILYFENVGTVQTPQFEERGPLPIDGPGLAAPELADLDGDGDLDLLVGGVSGGLLYFQNTSSTPRKP